MYAEIKHHIGTSFCPSSLEETMRTGDNSDHDVVAMIAEVITDQMVYSLLMAAFPLQSHVVSNIVACKANQHLLARSSLNSRRK